MEGHVRQWLRSFSEASYKESLCSIGSCIEPESAFKKADITNALLT